MQSGGHSGSDYVAMVTANKFYRWELVVNLTAKRPVEVFFNSRPTAKVLYTEHIAFGIEQNESF